MARTIVWAFCELPELNGQLAWVECDEALARELIASGRVQDPAVGALHLRDIEPGSVDSGERGCSAPASDTALAPDDYATTQLVARSTRRRGR